MNDRRRKIQRILQVQRQMHQVAEWKLARLARRAEELELAQVELIHTLNSDTGLHGLFVDTMARHLSRLAGEADEIGRAQAEQAGRVLAEARRMKTTERVSRRIDREQKRDEEKRRFQTILEAFAQRGDASLR